MVSSSIKRRRRSVNVEKRRAVPRGGRHQTDICERPQICIGMTRVAGERWGDHRGCIRAAAHSEPSAGVLRIARLASQRRVEHGHCPDVRKVFGCPPDNQARDRCSGVQAVLPVLDHPGRLDHGRDTLGREARGGKAELQSTYENHCKENSAGDER
jgi:hypothetical protein